MRRLRTWFLVAWCWLASATCFLAYRLIDGKPIEF